jgi:tRNA modification GTPase
VIVNEKPGTTRDEVESEVEFEGVRFQFVDTAGLRETQDEVEAEGVRRSYQSLAGADLVVEVVDLTDGGGGDTRLAAMIRLEHPTLSVLRIGNKIDLINVQDESTVELDMMIAAVAIGQDDTALNDLMKQIAVRTVGSDAVGEEHQVVTSSRQQSHLRAASVATTRAKAQLSSGASGDMLSSDIRQIIEEIGAITGEITNEDILDQIFSKFCIGK